VNFLTMKALLALLIFDVRGFGSNFPKMCSVVSHWPIAQRQIKGDVVQQVCDAVNGACVWYPKRVLCLQRSTVLTCLLRTQGVTAAMVVGAQNPPFKAHAWTEVDGMPINERRDVRTIYQVLDRC